MPPLSDALPLNKITVWLTNEPLVGWAWWLLQKCVQGKITFCSHQQLLQSHLTIEENLRFASTLYGQVPKHQLSYLLKESKLGGKVDKRPTYEVSRSENCLLSYLVALLPNPDAIMIDDLTDGLSLPAKRQMWQFILAEQSRHMRTIVYVTRDPEAAQVVADEVWLMDMTGVRRKCLKSELSQVLMPVTTFAFEFKNRAAAHYFQQRVINNSESLGVLSNHLQSDGVTLRLQVKEGPSSLLDLMLLMERDLANFAVIPSKGENLWETKDAHQKEQEDLYGNLKILMSKNLQKTSPSWSALIQLALSEWRRHFRRFWRAGNLIISAVYILTILSVVAGDIEGSVSGFLQYASLGLLFVAAMVVGFGTEGFGRLAITAEMDTIFEPARPPGRERPFSLLTFFDTTSVTRVGLLIGLCLGQLLVWGTHMVLFVVLWCWLMTTLPSWWFAFGSLLIWLLSALDGLAIAILLGCLSRRPGQGVVIGWVGWFFIVSSVGPLSSLENPLLWLWPFVGWTNSLYHLLEPARFWPPFLLALMGSGVLWVWAVWTFSRK